MQPLREVSAARYQSNARNARRLRSGRATSRGLGGYRLSKKADRKLSRIWRNISFGLFALTLISGAVIGGHVERGVSELSHLVDRTLVYAGFGIQKIEVTGLDRVSEAAIAAAITDETALSIWRLDTETAKTKIEALPWVRRAQVMRLLPSTLHIEIEERVPFAYWQYERAHYLVDEEGAVILAAEPGAYGPLPLIVGEGAPQYAGRLLASLMRYPAIASRVKALVRVGDRRWNVALRSGPDIFLPEGKIGVALRRLATYAEKKQILGDRYKSVDLRIAGRIVLSPNAPHDKRQRQILGAISTPSTAPGGV